LDGFASPDSIVIGTVGRLQTVKDQLTLTRAFVRLQTLTPEVRERLRLVIVGDGPLLGDVREILRTAGVSHLAWLPGAREDVPAILRGMDIFVLPSLAEGISNTILEAMACGLPVVATRVGGTPEIVSEGVTGLLVPPDDPEAMAQRIQMYIRDDELRQRHGGAARESVVRHFSLDRMMQHYVDVYDAVLSS